MKLRRPRVVAPRGEGADLGGMFPHDLSSVASCWAKAVFQHKTEDD